jgi:hypothetical protein
MHTENFDAGGYRFIPAVSQYSGGVAALRGLRIERVSFTQVVPLAAGFERIARHLAAQGRPNTALCACELRSPAPFTEQGFRDFNAVYIQTLRGWGLMVDAVNPVARSNVCPAVDPPADPGFHAFCYTVVDTQAPASFVIAGSGEAPEGRGDYRDHTIALGDVSPAGLRLKAQYVLGEMELRMQALGFGWPAVTATQVYSVHDIHPFLADELIRRGAMRHGVVWHYHRPPVQDLEYEMDCRGLSVERVLSA